MKKRIKNIVVTLFCVLFFVFIGGVFAYMGYSNQSIDLDKTDNFTGTVAYTNNYKKAFNVRFVDDLDRWFRVFRLNREYANLFNGVKTGDVVKIYHQKTNKEEVDVYQLENSNGDILYSKTEFENKSKLIWWSGVGWIIVVLAVFIWLVYNKRLSGFGKMEVSPSQMLQEFKDYETTISRKHSFGWTPKYETKIRTSLNKTVFVPVTVQTFQKLGWTVTHQEEHMVHAMRESDWGNVTEEISVSYSYNEITVKSISHGNEYWDKGRNSKRVGLFIYAFQQTEKGYDTEALNQLEIETEKVNKMEDYVIPRRLPEPIVQVKAKFWVPVVGSFVLSILLGIVIAYLSVKAIYVIGLFEVVVGVFVGVAFKYVIKISNYTVYSTWNYLLIVTIFLTYVSNQYFQYQLFQVELDYPFIDFFDFMKFRFEAGLTIKSINTGSIGLVISWLFQLGFTYAVGYFLFVGNLSAYLINKVSMDVIEFAVYHFKQGKTEQEVREELSKMGWTKTEDQDDVMVAIVEMG